MDALTRFMRKVDFVDSGCWEWTGSDSGNGRGGGYGRFWANGTTNAAHRWIYEKFFGRIPKSKELDHKCENRKCVHPLHTIAVTHKVNCKRRDRKDKKC